MDVSKEGTMQYRYVVLNELKLSTYGSAGLISKGQ
jgi:hypothetical protein